MRAVGWAARWRFGWLVWALGVGLALSLGSACTDNAAGSDAISGVDALEDQGGSDGEGPGEDPGPSPDPDVPEPEPEPEPDVPEPDTPEPEPEPDVPVEDVPEPDAPLEGCFEDECEIDGECVANGTENPDNPCEVCQVLQDPMEWTANDEGECDDGDVCTLDDYCEDGECVGYGLACDDGDVCTDDSCDPETGECSYATNAAPCDDGDACTLGDICAAGSCLPGSEALLCEDSDVCRTATCDPAVGCTWIANEGPCDDGDPCTIDDVCVEGGCMSGAVETCDDGDICTIDVCTLDGCEHKSVADLCADDNPCTDEACDAELGCVYPPNSAPCDDGDACTTDDVCSDGACGGAGVPVDDGNPCTDDLCDPVMGVMNLPNTAPCDDGDACTLGDVCSGGVCTPGPDPLVCDDGEVCTDDSCDPASGCVTSDNTAPCDDGTVCTENDTCAGGTCGGTPISCDDGNDCTADSCNANSGCVNDLISSNACRPNFTVDYPPRAATIQDTTQEVVVTGSVTSGAGPIESLTLNGATVTVAADGSFSAPVTPAVGGNTLLFEATDSFGSLRKRVQSYLWSPVYRKPDKTVPKSGMVDPGVGIWLAQEAIDDGDRTLPPDDLATIFNLILQNFDLNGLLPNPLAEDVDAGTGIGTYDVALSNLTWGATQTTLTSVPGGLSLVAIIPNVNADLQATKTCGVFQGCLGPGTINGDINIAAITITGTIQLSVNAQNEIVATLSSSNVSVTGVNVNIDGLLAFIIEPIVQGAVNDFIPDIEQQFNQQIQTVIGPLLQDALTALAFNTSFDFPKLDNSGESITIDLVTDFSATNFDTPGGEILLRAGAYADKAIAYDNLGAMGRAGCNAAAQQLLFIKDHPFEISLADDVLNQLLYAAWNGGLLEFPVPPTLLGDLDLGSFGISNLQLNVSGMLQPTASDCNASAELLMHVGDLRIDATLELFGQPLTVVVFASFSAGLDLTASSEGIAIALTEITEAQTEVTVLEDAFISSESVIDGLIQDNLIPGLLETLGGGEALASFPLPEIDLSGAVDGLPPGTVIAINPIDVIRIEGNTSVGGTLK